MSKITCPHCKRNLNIPEKYAGQSVKCPACQGVFQVPPPEPIALDLEAVILDAPPPPPLPKSIPVANDDSLENEADPLAFLSAASPAIDSTSAERGPRSPSPPVGPLAVGGARSTSAMSTGNRTALGCLTIIAGLFVAGIIARALEPDKDSPLPVLVVIIAIVVAYFVWNKTEHRETER